MLQLPWETKLPNIDKEVSKRWIYQDPHWNVALKWYICDSYVNLTETSFDLFMKILIDERNQNT